MIKTTTEKTEELKPRIERLTKLVIPHQDSDVTFVYPGEGPDNYQNVFERILERNLRVPTREETASLLYAVYCDEKFGNEPKSKEIKEIMRKRWLWIANRNLWTEKGVYVVPDEKGVGRSENLEINDLEKLLKGSKEINGIRFSKDGKVRFAPKDNYKLEYNSSDELSQNGFVIASYGRQGAEQLAEVSTKFSDEPYVYGLNIQKGYAPELRCSALDGFNGDRLGVDGGNFDYNWDGHAFGVLK